MLSKVLLYTPFYLVYHSMGVRKWEFMECYFNFLHVRQLCGARWYNMLVYTRNYFNSYWTEVLDLSLPGFNCMMQAHSYSKMSRTITFSVAWSKNIQETKHWWRDVAIWHDLCGPSSQQWSGNLYCLCPENWYVTYYYPYLREQS